MMYTNRYLLHRIAPRAKAAVAAVTDTVPTSRMSRIQLGSALKLSLLVMSKTMTMP